MKTFLASIPLTMSALTPAVAQVELKTYANTDGYIETT